MKTQTNPVAADSKSAEQPVVAKSALTELAKVDAQHLDAMLETCKTQSPAETIYAAASLMRANTPALLNNSLLCLKYLANLAKSATELSDLKLLGFSQYGFIIMRTHSLFDYLVHLVKNAGEKADNETENTIQCVKKEILLLIELNRIITLSDSISFNPSTAGKEKSWQTLADEYTQRLLQLKQGETALLATGWISHGFYLVFIRHLNEIYIRVDNFGEGSNRKFPKIHRYFSDEALHQCDTDGNYLPRFIGKVALHNDTKRLNNYIKKVLHLFICSPPLELALPVIYNFYHDLPYPGIIPVKNKGFPLQAISNCVLYNYEIGMHLRLEQHLTQKQIASIFLHEKNYIAQALKNDPISSTSIQLSTQFKNHPCMINSSSILLRILEITNFKTLMHEADIYALSQCLMNTRSSDSLRLSTKSAYEHLQNITHINLNNLKLNDDDIIALSPILPGFSNLTELSLDHNTIGDAGVIALTNVMHRCKKLNRVLLGNNQIKDEGMHHLLEVKFRNKELTISAGNNPFGKVGEACLLEIKKENPQPAKVKTTSLAVAQPSPKHKIQIILRKFNQTADKKAYGLFKREPHSRDEIRGAWTESSSPHKRRRNNEEKNQPNDSAKTVATLNKN